MKSGKAALLILPLVLSVFLMPLAVEAQQAAKVPRLGFLAIGSAMNPRQVAFLDELRVLGYLEGRTITIEYRWAEGRRDRLPALAAELVALPVDILVTAGGAPAVRAAKQATTSIPIVAMIMNEPVEAGLVSSLASAGRQCDRTCVRGLVDQHQAARAAQRDSP